LGKNADKSSKGIKQSGLPEKESKESQGPDESRSHASAVRKAQGAESKESAEKSSRTTEKSEAIRNDAVQKIQGGELMAKEFAPVFWKGKGSLKGLFKGKPLYLGQSRYVRAALKWLKKHE